MLPTNTNPFNCIFTLIGYCKGPFFLPTLNQAQKSQMSVLRAQSQLSLVICGNKKVRRSGFKPLIKPKAQNRPTQS